MEKNWGVSSNTANGMPIDIGTLSTGYFGNIWWRLHRLAEGAKSDGHRHHFDHVTFLTKGTIQVMVQGFDQRKFTAPHAIVIEKDRVHSMRALTDVEYWCIFALRDDEGGVTNVYSGHDKPYGSADHLYMDRVETEKALEHLTEKVGCADCTCGLNKKETME